MTKDTNTPSAYINANNSNTPSAYLNDKTLTLQMRLLVRHDMTLYKLLADEGVLVCHYFNPGDNAIQASCSRRALERPVPGQDAILAHPLVQGVLCEKTRR